MVQWITFQNLPVIFTYTVGVTYTTMSSEVQTLTQVKALIGIMTIVVYNLHS